MSFRGLTAAVLLCSLTACANMNGGGEDKMSMSYLRQHLVSNQTTKADVAQMFGQPRYKNEEANGADYWAYSEEQINGRNYLTDAAQYIPGLGSLGNAAVQSQTKKPNRDLNIFFNSNGTVRQFNTSGSTGAGS
ncbi:hypothetical protein [Bordetella genomosp. 11]|uniref:Lipoprotein SmpA/OmlA domain-containing protein n=1 Tax=Bordetella genomosp. 11 TaxID=1416808 RepID=A0A261UF33_9BORD|nr:hypothetical protein [Bordetella genomosp. 11]OZI60548.1 hypothetical protein CAL28_14160 [Bordetella genomosp. 11]